MLRRKKHSEQTALHSSRWLFSLTLAATAGLALAAEQYIPRAGDVKDGYESSSYRTASKSLQSRQGKKADLYGLTQKPPLGLPSVPKVKDNPLSAKGIELGRKLFFDRRLSINNTMSCAICHVPEMGFAHNELQTSVGVEGRSVRRNAPTMLNAAYRKLLFHDGREDTLENQVWAPFLASNEMANPSIGSVLNKIKNIDEYDGMFEEVFNGTGATVDTVGKALAQYSRALLSANSRFDRWYYGKEKDALNEEEKKGFEIFVGKGRCSACHLIGEKYALFSDDKLHNTGLGFNASMKKTPDKQKVQLAPGVFVEMSGEDIDSVTRPDAIANDLGRYEVTQNPNDRWKYVTPTLRNVALTEPYMHDGSMLSLEEVIDFYDKGGVPNELISPLITPLSLTAAEKKALKSFLLTLTGSNYAELVGDAFVAPIGELRDNDPFWANEYIRGSPHEKKKPLQPSGDKPQYQ